MDFDGTILLITTQVPVLKHNRVETGFDWYEFGKMVKASLWFSDVKKRMHNSQNEY